MIAVLLALTAHASTVVLHAGGETEALRAEVVKHLPDPTADLTFMPMGSSDDPAVASWGDATTIQPCATQPQSPEELKAALTKAEGHLLYLELDQASGQLEAARASLACTQGLIDHSAAAQLGLLLGVLAVENGDKATAFDQFSLAVRFDPDVAWNSQFAPAGERVLTAARQEFLTSSKTPVQLLPAVTPPFEVAVNGKILEGSVTELQLAEGPNWIQLKTGESLSGMMLSLQPAAARHKLYLPKALQPSVLGLVESEAGREDLADLVQQMVPVGTPVYLAHDEQLWRTASGVRVWENLVGGPPPSSTGGWTTTQWVLAGAGTAVAITGAVVALSASSALDSKRESLFTAAASGDIEAARRLQGEHDSLRSRRAVGYTLTGLGGVMAISGVLLQMEIPLGGKAKERAQ